VVHGINDDRIPKVGDLVCHYIYPKNTWMAILLETTDLTKNYKKGRSFVRMVPGVAEEYFFPHNCRSGWVYTKWLWVLSRS
tara:strand:+ start:501 stop:743 length:243 start_codon:yes stop_codon:yes gene_type:complete